MKRKSWIVYVALMMGAGIVVPLPALAKTFNIAQFFWGNNVSVPVDPDGIAGQTCAETADGFVYYCPPDAAIFSYHGRETLGPDLGPFSGENINEGTFVAGTGCSLAPDTAQGCSIGSTTNGCLIQAVATAGTTFFANGDVLIYGLGTFTTCIDYTHGLPFNFNSTGTFNVTGGTGKFAGASGSFTSNANGQVLISDPAGRIFDWGSGTLTGTVRVP